MIEDTYDDFIRNRYRLDGALKAIGALIYVARAHGLKMDLPFEPLEKSEMMIPVQDMRPPSLPGKTVRHIDGQWVVTYKNRGMPLLHFSRQYMDEGYDFSTEEAWHVVSFEIFKDHDNINNLRVAPDIIFDMDFLTDLEQPLELWFKNGHHLKLHDTLANDGTALVNPAFQPDDVVKLLAVELLYSVPVAIVRGDRAIILDALEDRGMLDLFRADINPDTSKNYCLGTIVTEQ